MEPLGVEEVLSNLESSRRSSFRVNDDEQELRWAALEKLPTIKRAQTTIVKSAVDGVHKEVDVKKMGAREREEFIKKVLRVADEGNQRLLSKLRDRFSKVGVKLPTVEVRFHNLTVEAKCFIGNRALPTLLNSARNLAESVLEILGIKLAERTKLLIILKDVSGIIKPSRMTLLLGPPSSGKTTLLLALAGKLDQKLKAMGEIKYNGYKFNEFVPQKTATYISQNDMHTTEMTVRETLDFSARCQGVGARYDLLMDLARKEKEAGIYPEPELDLFMKAIAMEGVRSSMLTDYILRVISRKDQEQYWADKSKPYSYVSVSQFAENFKKFHVALQLEKELSIPFDKSCGHKASLVFSKHSVSYSELLEASFAKEWLLIKRNAFVYIFKTVQVSYHLTVLYLS
ncbi:uncharacterized protein A4U43_C01F19880 [Asparagus officinalis]|uniref:ABC transporter domain-containing protein n=1 Tax=Asparagus officinalis TaxID=4686 RepID=A0A5P1FV83_ASPOF|nr:uncharacterized protein A4U43_C01F19880 [Asparagus officinalis]